MIPIIDESCGSCSLIVGGWICIRRFWIIKTRMRVLWNKRATSWFEWYTVACGCGVKIIMNLLVLFLLLLFIFHSWLNFTVVSHWIETILFSLYYKSRKFTLISILRIIWIKMFRFFIFFCLNTQIFIFERIVEVQIPEWVSIFMPKMHFWGHFCIFTEQILAKD